MFNLVLLLNGIFTNGNPETIKKYKESVSLFLVSETCLINNLVSIGIEKNNVVSMANNYIKFQFKGCPNMFPKLLMMFIDYNVKFTELMITGITFYMDLLWDDDTLKKSIDETYHPNYHNWDTKIPKELQYLSNYEKSKYHLNRIKELGTEKTDKIVHNHFIEENFVFFLGYCQYIKDKRGKGFIKFDNNLELIIKKYMELHA